MVKILCVAEKPSMSKALTQILSGGQFNSVRPRFTADPSFTSALGRKYYLMLYDLSSYVCVCPFPLRFMVVSFMSPHPVSPL